jgi:hypothetical protein
LGLIWPLKGLTQAEGTTCTSASSNQHFCKVNFHILVIKKSKLECFVIYCFDIFFKSPFFDPEDEKFEEKITLFKHISNH